MKQQKCPLAGDQGLSVIYIYTVGYSGDIEKNKVGL